QTQHDFRAEFNRGLAPLLPDKRFDGVDELPEGYRVRFLGRDKSVYDLDELSASERQAVLFVATFMQAGLNHSLVLIDSPELYVPPAHQAALFAGLAALGNGNQIIAATESTEILASVPSAQVIDFRRRRG